MIVSKQFAKLVLCAAFAAIGSVVIPYLLLLAFPVAVHDGGPAPNILPGTAHTMEELEKANRESLERLKRNDQAAPKRDEIYQAARKSFWWSTWIPWLFLPFVVLVRLRASDILLVATPLLSMLLIGWLLPIEGVLSAVSLVIGIAFIYMRAKVLK